MPDQQQPTITPEDLIRRGFKPGDGVITQYERVIEGFENLNEPPMIALTSLRNAPEFALFTGDSVLYLNPASLDELDVLSKMIVAYEPVY